MRARSPGRQGATIRVLSCNDLEVSEGELAEGWLGDPLGRHEERWFSRGAASSHLVRDDAVEGHDPVSEDEQRSVGAMTLPPLPVSDKPPQPLIDLGPSMTERYLVGRSIGSLRRSAMLRPWAPLILGFNALVGLVLLGAGLYGALTYAPVKLPPHQVVGIVSVASPGAFDNRIVEQIQVTSVSTPQDGQHTLFHLVRQSGQVRRGPRGPRVLRARVARCRRGSVSTYAPTATSGDWALIIAGSVLVTMSVIRTVLWTRGRRHRDGSWRPKQAT